MHIYQFSTRLSILTIMLFSTNSLYAVDNLSADELRSLFSGTTVEGGYVEGTRQGVMNFYSEPFINYFGDDGKVYSVRGKSSKSGNWNVIEEGQLCFTWKDKKEKCAPIYREGDHYKQIMVNRKGKIKWTKTYTTFTSGDISALQDK